MTKTANLLIVSEDIMRDANGFASSVTFRLTAPTLRAYETYDFDGKTEQWVYNNCDHATEYNLDGVRPENREFVETRLDCWLGNMRQAHEDKEDAKALHRAMYGEIPIEPSQQAEDPEA